MRDMPRRTFLASLAASATAASGQSPEPKEDVFVSSASRKSTPRVGLIGSTFTGFEDHDGTKIAGLREPRPLDAELTPGQWAEMVRMGLDNGLPVGAAMKDLIGPNEWVVVFVDGTGAAVLPELLAYLQRCRCGGRITVIGRHAVNVPGFERWDLATADRVPMPSPGEPKRMYGIPRPLQQCDRIIVVAPLGTDPRLGARLSLGAYLSLIEGGKMEADARAAASLFAIRPADLVVLGGAAKDAPARHNVVVVGSLAVNVDAVGASVMGFAPAELAQLHLASQKGFNRDEVELITDLTWIRGSGIEEIRREYPKPRAWRPYKAKPEGAKVSN